MTNRIPVADYVAFDLETTGLSPAKDEILEVALVKFKGGKIADKWSSLTRPTRPVPLKCLRLTGIPKEDLARSPTISEVCEIIEEYRENLPLVGHNPQFDTAFLEKVIDGFPGVPVYDTLELSRIVFPALKSYRLSELASRLGVRLDEAHRAYDDAEATGIIFSLIQEKIMSMPWSVRERILRIMGTNWVPGHLFAENMLNKLVQPVLFVKVAQQKDSVMSSKSGKNEVGCCKLGVFGDHRENAVLIGKKFVRILGEDNLYQVMVETNGSADTALGVVTAVQNYVDSHDIRVILAGFPLDTGEIEQSNAAYLGCPGDYLCLFRFRRALFYAQKGIYSEIDLDSKRFLSSLISWQSTTKQGLSRELQITANARRIWRELACPKDVSCKSLCPLAEDCYYVRAKITANSKAVIFTSKEGLFESDGQYEKGIVWDFHELKKVLEQREPRIDLGKLKDTLLAEGYAELGNWIDEFAAGTLKKVFRRDVLLPPEVKKMLVQFLKSLSTVTSELRQRLREKYPEITCFPVLSSPPLVSMNLHKLEYWEKALKDFLAEDNTSVQVIGTGFKEDGTKTVVLSRKNIWPGKRIRTMIGNRCKSLILLSNLSSLIYDKEGLRYLYGVPDPVKFFSMKGEKNSGPSINVLVVAVDKCPVPTPAQYPSYVSDFLFELSQKQRKGCLCLFSSGTLLKDVYSILAPKLEEKDIAVFAQGVDGGFRVLEYLKEPDALVLAKFSATLDERITVNPSCVVIPRVPFSLPDTVNDMRKKEFFQRGKNGFVEVDVCSAVMTVRACVEKMAGGDKKSAVVFLDPRILPGRRGWGKEFMDGFSDFQKVFCPQKECVSLVFRWINGSNVIA